MMQQFGSEGYVRQVRSMFVGLSVRFVSLSCSTGRFFINYGVSVGLSLLNFIDPDGFICLC